MLQLSQRHNIPPPKLSPTPSQKLLATMPITKDVNSKELSPRGKNSFPIVTHSPYSPSIKSFNSSIPLIKSPYSPTISPSIPKKFNTIPSSIQIPLREIDGETDISITKQSIVKIRDSNITSLNPTVEILNLKSAKKDFQELTNSSLENELFNNGYSIINKIIVHEKDGNNRVQYIKVINKKGQKLFILLDVPCYTSSNPSDLVLVESNNINVVPYSLKIGSYNCAAHDVNGIVFECGVNSVCMMIREIKEITPKEINYVFVEQQITKPEDNIMTYPIVRLSEIRVQPELILHNTDMVTRRLRNSKYTTELKELSNIQQSANNLNESIYAFYNMSKNTACKINKTLDQLEQWNDRYISNPPQNDDVKDRWINLHYNLVQRNEAITTLISSMKKVTDKRAEIDTLSKEINDIIEYCEKEFVYIEYATVD